MYADDLILISRSVRTQHVYSINIIDDLQWQFTTYLCPELLFVELIKLLSLNSIEKRRINLFYVNCFSSPFN